VAQRVQLTGDADFQAEVAGDRVTLEGVNHTFTLSAGSKGPASIGSASRDGEPDGGRVFRPGAEEGGVSIDTPDGVVHAITATRGDTIWIGIGEYVFEFVARQGGRRRSTSADEDALSAPMPATVVRILVKPGVKVAKGDLLIALEAMKMELGIRAPHDGVVTDIHCQEGELVQPGRALLTL
jgi:acetyl/propionyl-CoA carboxylase alpha subunit